MGNTGHMPVFCSHVAHHHSPGGNSHLLFNIISVSDTMLLVATQLYFNFLAATVCFLWWVGLYNVATGKVARKGFLKKKNKN